MREIVIDQGWQIFHAKPRLFLIYGLKWGLCLESSLAFVRSLLTAHHTLQFAGHFLSSQVKETPSNPWGYLGR